MRRVLCPCCSCSDDGGSEGSSEEDGDEQDEEWEGEDEENQEEAARELGPLAAQSTPSDCLDGRRPSLFSFWSRRRGSGRLRAEKRRGGGQPLHLRLLRFCTCGKRHS